MLGNISCRKWRQDPNKLEKWDIVADITENMELWKITVNNYILMSWTMWEKWIPITYNLPRPYWGEMRNIQANSKEKRLDQ